MQRCLRILNSNGVFGVKVGLPLRRRRRSEEGTAQKSGFQLHGVCDGLKMSHTALEVFGRRNPIHCIYAQVSMS